MIKIYGLIDPVTGELRYVGKTKLTLERRNRSHVSDARRRPRRVKRFAWIMSLLNQGLIPDIFEIEEISISQWQEAEQFWIMYFRFIGCDLLNATAGGDGIHDHKHTEKTIEKMAKSATLRYQRPGEKEKTGTAVSLALNQPEARNNLSTAAKKRMLKQGGNNHGIVALIKFSQSEEGHKASSKRHKGKIVSKETRDKLSKKKKGVKMPEGFGENVSAR